MMLHNFKKIEKKLFQKDNCERIVEILQKLLYNTLPLGPYSLASIIRLALRARLTKSLARQ
jgi:hypothetical protein